jgi:hypothetical protein
MAVLTGRATLSAKSMHHGKASQTEMDHKHCICCNNKIHIHPLSHVLERPFQILFLNKTTKEKHHHLVMKSSLKKIDDKLLPQGISKPIKILTDPSKQKETGKWVLGLVVPVITILSLLPYPTLPYPTHSTRKKIANFIYFIYLFVCFFTEMGRRNSQRGGKESVDNVISESRKVSLKNPPS